MRNRTPAGAVLGTLHDHATRSTRPLPGPAAFDFEISHALQPILDVTRGQAFAHEALVRGTGGESAAEVFGRVDGDARYHFDQKSRIQAIELAARVKLDTCLAINFMPNAVYDPSTSIEATLDAARRCSFPEDRLIFEVTEAEKVEDLTRLRETLQACSGRGFKTAIDDFGAGYSGLDLLVDFQPDFLKLDAALIRHIDQDRVRRSIVQSVLALCRELGIRPIAEGVETAAESGALQDMGVVLQQGYLFAPPQLRAVPAINDDAFRTAGARQKAGATAKPGGGRPKTEPVTTPPAGSHFAPGTTIAYDAKLIGRLKERHRQLLALCDSIREAVDGGDGKQAHRDLHLFGQTLQQHVLEANLKLYIYLSKCLAQEPENGETVQRMRRELEHLAMAVTRFVHDYKASGINPDNSGKFLTHLRAIRGILTERARREEETLYNRYLPPAAYAVG